MHIDTANTTGAISKFPTATGRLTDEKLSIYSDALAKVGHGELKRIRVGVSDGAVTLGGRVSSYYLKQTAQEAVRPFAIGLDIRNEIVVATGKASA